MIYRLYVCSFCEREVFYLKIVKNEIKGKRKIKSLDLVLEEYYCFELLISLCRILRRYNLRDIDRFF